MKPDHDDHRAERHHSPAHQGAGQTRVLVPSGIEAMVCEDIAARQRMGINKYGTTVSLNPLPLRAWLQHAYEEALDQAIYLRRAIEQIDRDADHPPHIARP